MASSQTLQNGKVNKQGKKGKNPLFIKKLQKFNNNSFFSKNLAALTLTL